ncbi:YcnI family copper-binding membrane protein [Kutzneria sp. CA-103260]|uniref:YcnI family copper-binding membrane protein n=1 Tax=Kutzneria sp. CA-103260 TaxID=2802641 RepID=UPI001BA81B58|nr:YcnI family protein [Kutzneria sp. CA-103260]QUQ64362.1 hypothetical protein JJ691_20820 [Kutzneria sp. CA-103260]
MRSVLTACGVVTLMLLAAGTAAAHVRVSAPQAVAGQPATLDFRVPSEKEVATTVRVSVRIPSGVTVSSVDPKPGWTVRQGAGEIVWTADARDAIGPDQAADFTVRAAMLPDQPSIAFAAHQTYSDGTVVDWDQPNSSDEFPAPTLKLSGYTTPAPPKPAAEQQPPSDWQTPLLFSASGLISTAALVLLVLRRRRVRESARRI